jgi:hypothetical protein
MPIISLYNRSTKRQIYIKFREIPFIIKPIVFNLLVELQSRKLVYFQYDNETMSIYMIQHLFFHY